ncbi:hypothetical protein LUZ60_007341 [Juncus effusus]|nr:hypothetical protein LUZ60_007341 [Juncus effusus]
MAFLPSSPIFLILFISLIILPNSISASLEDSCKAVAKHSPNINADFCITSLQVDPSSQSANSIGLALIAVNLASKNATSTKSEIENYLKDPSKSNVKAVLDTCEELYSDMIGTLSKADKAIRSFSYGDAKTYLSAALDAPATCEDSFEEQGVASVLAKEDGNAEQLCALALALISI